MARRKEYLPIGKNPKFNSYHKRYDQYRLESQILNGGGRHPSFDTILWDRNSIESEIIWLKGNAKGMYYDRNSGEESLALIPQAKRHLKELDHRFQNYQQQRVNEGNYRPTEMPSYMLEERLKIEARLDVYKEELMELGKRRKVYKDEEDKEHEHMLLAYGVASSGSLRDSILVELDGQTVSLNSKNILIIDDEGSPYDGLLVADYKEFISKPWRLATEKLRNKKAELSRKLISRGMYEEHFNTEWEKLQKQMIEENGWGHLFAIKLPKKPKIPKVPEHLKNYKKHPITS